MTLTLAIVAALSLAAMGDRPAAAPAQDVVAETLIDTSDGPHAMRDRFRAETRDAIWAAQAEAALRTAYGRVRSLDMSDQPAISCAASLCQVAGRAPAKGSQAANEALMAALQDRSLAPKGLEIVASSFASAKGRGTGFSYVTYFRRAATS